MTVSSIRNQRNPHRHVDRGAGICTSAFPGVDPTGVRHCSLDYASTDHGAAASTKSRVTLLQLER
eukprot:1436097-Lingulodinium_polyedra.AAC.1